MIRVVRVAVLRDTSVLSLSGSDGKASARLTVVKDAPYLVLTDKDGRQIWSAP